MRDAAERQAIAAEAVEADANAWRLIAGSAYKVARAVAGETPLAEEWHELGDEERARHIQEARAAVDAEGVDRQLSATGRAFAATARQVFSILVGATTAAREGYFSHRYRRHRGRAIDIDNE